MRQTAPTRVELPAPLDVASIMRLRVEGVAELLPATVPAEQARIETGQTAELAFYATWALPSDADSRQAG